jgi:hypothetical protein
MMSAGASSFRCGSYLTRSRKPIQSTRRRCDPRQTREGSRLRAGRTVEMLQLLYVARTRPQKALVLV